MAKTFKMRLRQRTKGEGVGEIDYSVNVPDSVRLEQAKAGVRYGNHRRMRAKEKVRERRDERLEVKVETRQVLEDDHGT